MSVPYTLHIVECHNVAAVEAAVEEVFREIDTTYNIWNPYSELSRFNSHEIGTPFPLSKHLCEMLTLARTLSNDYFDPTRGAAIAAWKASLPFGQEAKGPFPSGWEHIDLETGVKYAPVVIDLDGLIKGYGVDAIVGRLKKLGYTSYCVEWGGDIAVGGRPWRIAIGGGERELSEGAIATSGNEQQRFLAHGTWRTHIVDKKGFPLHAEKVTSISVIAPTCLLADVLATTAMLLPDEHVAAKWVEQHYPEALITPELAFQ
jgi:thiamine biosynthesis lipoprotein